MTARDRIRPAPFTVIVGGRRSAKTAKVGSAALPRLRRPAMTPDALACEMARIYALTLLRDIPFAELSDPQRGVWIDAATRFTLHELQTELRQLPWPSSGQPVLTTGDSPLSNLLSLGVPGDADHCAAIPDARNGQPQCKPVLSAFFELAPPRAAGPVGTGLSVPGVTHPGASQPMSHWLLWIEAACGASLPQPGRTDSARQTLRTPRDLAIQVHRRHPCQAYFSAALQLLSQGLPMETGLRRDGPRVLTLLLNGARRAEQLCRRSERGPRLARPGVVAARWSLMQSGEDLRGGPDAVLEQAALDRVKAAAPRLLHWVARMNRAAGTGGFALPTPEGGSCEGWTPLEFHQNLILPSLEEEGPRLCPSQGAGQAVLAGTMVTLLKALFNASCADGAQPERSAVAEELDRLAANMTLGRSIAGGFYDAENRQGLRLGQSLGLTLLREALEDEGAPALLDLSDFDGRRIDLQARRNGPGRVRVSLQVDGAFAPWPDNGGVTAPYLTAVV